MKILNYWLARLTVVLVLVFQLTVQAQLMSFDITASNSNTGADMTLGWEFVANDDFIISSLGFYDLDADGLLASHQVGLWSSTGTLLGSVTITPTSTPDGGFYYENLTNPIALSNGNSYRIAAHVLGDGFVYGGENITTESNIAIGQTYRGFPGFTFPTQNDGRQYLTANFKVLPPAAIKSFNITSSNSNTAADMTLGWEFDVNSNITVTSLGFFDLDGDGLLASHQVGLWSSAGTLLGSVTVTPASSPINGFYYANLTTPINLVSGGTYRIAAHVIGDGFVYGADNIITDPAITKAETYRGFPGFTFPTQNDGREYITCNFLLETPSLPEILLTKVDAIFLDINGNGLVEPGDQVRYTITINNTGLGDATAVSFTDTPDANSTLVMGSVTTTQGSVTMGNGGGDTDVTVDIGTIAPAGSATITFDVGINFPLAFTITELSNQGQVTGDNFTTVMTDDPDLGGASDPTVTPIMHPAGPFMISYQVVLPDCDNPPASPLVVTDGDFMEGESFTFPPYTVPAQYSAYQHYYNAFVGAEFGIPVGSLNEDIHIVINLQDICTGGLIDNPDTQEIIELFFLSVKITGSVSGDHSSLEYYYFNDGKEAYLKIPIGSISALSEFFNFDRDLLIPFFTTNGLNPDFNGIRKEVDASFYTIFARHFSEVRLGIVNTPTGINDQSEALPTQYRLNQNYPNPFNPSTSISYSIPNDGQVTLAIYDVLGNEVAILENKYKSAGSYSYSFDASKLTSGIYFYTIKAGKFMETKKMLLMK